jgi:DNA transposition AAA+ family ATPase
VKINSQADAQAFDQLRENARIKGASRVLPDDIRPDAVTPEQAAQVVGSINAYREQTGFNIREISRALGKTAAAISPVLAGPFDRRSADLIIALDRWLEGELKRRELPRPSNFVLTRVAEAVMTVAEVACALKGIGLVYGWAGIGKTTALRALAAERPGSVFISIKTASASQMGVLHSIAAAFGLRDVYAQNQRGITGRLEQLLAGTPRLIIIDEIHKLCGTKDDKTLHVLRDLYDATGAPMLWSSTLDLVKYLDRNQARGREPLAQIRSRICVARDLTDVAGSGGGDGGGDALYSMEEIRRVMTAGKMRLAPDAVRYLFKLANLPDSGALRTCQNLVFIAAKINAERSSVLTAAMLQDAHQLLVSRRDFTALQSNINSDDAPAVARVG